MHRPQIWHGLVVLGAFFTLVTVSRIVQGNEEATNPSCYTLLSVYYPTQKQYIDRAMADGKLTNKECDGLFDNHNTAVTKSKKENALRDYYLVKSGKPVPDSEDD